MVQLRYVMSEGARPRGSNQNGYGGERQKRAAPSASAPQPTKSRNIADDPVDIERENLSHNPSKESGKGKYSTSSPDDPHPRPDGC